MKRSVKVKLPINLNNSDRCYFKNTCYELAPLKVYELSNVVITSIGTCLINNSIVKESIHGYRDKITIYTLLSKLNILNHKTIFPDDSDYYLMIHSPVFSYYHWLTESIPRLLMVKPQIEELTLLLPVSLKNIDYVKESLAPFSFKDIFYIPENANIKVRHLVLPQIKPYHTSYYPETVEEIRHIYTDYSNKSLNTKVKYSDILFLYDETKNKPNINNIGMLKSIMDRFKIRFINPSDCSLFSLVQLVQKAELIISVTCNIMACISFMKKGTSVLELIKPQSCEIDKPDLRFINLASNLGLNYYYLFCKSQGNKNEDYRIIIDPLKLEKSIEQILSK